MMFTYYTIIGKDLDLLKGHVENIKEYAGFNKLTCKKEFLIIVYKNSTIPQNITQDILDYCCDAGIRTFLYEEPTTIFLDNLYACFNLGYELSKGGFVFRAGSDQVFSKDSFVFLYEEALKIQGQKIILQANTIENDTQLKAINYPTRHFRKSFGNNFSEFDYTSFEGFCYEINKNVDVNLVDIDTALRVWGHPTAFSTTIGNINRVDGCSWLMTRDDWTKYGPMPTKENNITGDVVIHDRLQKAGYTEYIVRDCVTYHFVQSERSKK